MPDEPKPAQGPNRQAMKIGAKITRLSTDNKSLAKELADAKATLATLTTENTGLKQQVGNPGVDRKRVLELEGQIRSDKHKGKFRELAKASGMNESAIDDLFNLSGYKAEADEPDPAALQALIAKAKTERPYAFGTAASGDGGKGAGQGGEQRQTKEIPGQGRGAFNNGSDGTFLSKEDRANPRKMLDPAFRAKIAKAAKEGTLQYVD